MTAFHGTPEFTHGSRETLGVLLVNLGTPDAPTPSAVRRYLKEFLWDPRVVEVPRPIWWLVLNGIILNTRPRRSAHAYQQVWTPEGSPLMVLTRRLAARLQDALRAKRPGAAQRIVVEVGMTYGNPSLPDALKRLQAAGARRILVLPLYPQYSGTTTASIFDRVTRELTNWRWVPELRFINGWHEHRDYHRALADSVREHWATAGRSHLLFSFHSIPKRYLLEGDPYHCFCHATARGVAAALELGPEDWSVAFQSRIGTQEWLKPYTDIVLTDYAKNGPKQVTVICPGFATDCLETLEEIAMRGREDFLAAGGTSFGYVPALNDGAAHAALLADVVLQHAGGWPEADPAYAEAAVDDAAAGACERARAMGAER
jgi:protoporphyrin/coproporphyrin ferrochelatase